MLELKFWIHEEVHVANNNIKKSKGPKWKLPADDGANEATPK